MRHRSSLALHLAVLGAHGVFLAAVMLFIAASLLPQYWEMGSRGGAAGDLESALRLVRSVKGFVLLVALPGAALVLAEVPGWVRRMRADRARNVDAGAEGETRAPLGRRPTPLLLPAAVLTICVVASTTATYVLAERPGGDEGRAAARIPEEAASIADHGVTLADGEAFDGDIQILRNAEEPRLRDPATPGVEQLTALRQMLLLNTNRFSALSILDLSGEVLVTTDESVVESGDNTAYREARAEGGVAAVFGEEDIHYAAPIFDGGGNIHSILLARTTGTRLWSQTLSMSIDGSRSFIVDASGTGRGAAQGETIVLPSAASDGTMPRVELAGAPAYCAARSIGAGTHLDAGLRVASCLPAEEAPLPATSTRLPMARAAGVAVASAAFGVVALVYLLRGVRRPERAVPASVRALEARLLSQREFYP